MPPSSDRPRLVLDMPRLQTYQVIIPYREPTYEIRQASPRKKPYISEVTVSAVNPKEAEESAIREFRQRAMNSSVFWVREIDRSGIRVIPTAD